MNAKNSVSITGSGKVSSLTESESSLWNTRKKQIDFYGFQVADFREYSTDSMKYDLVCQHMNNYWLCQQCEVRIREQDLLDRISITLDSATFSSSYTVSDYLEMFVIKGSNLILYKLEPIIKEFSDKNVIVGISENIPYLSIDKEYMKWDN